MAVRDIEDMERLGAADPGIWPTRLLSAQHDVAARRVEQLEQLTAVTIAWRGARTQGENVAAADYSCVIGDYSQALAPGALVIGTRSTASGIGSLALGNFLTAERGGQVLIESLPPSPGARRLRACFEGEYDLFMSCLMTVSIEHYATVEGIVMHADVYCSCGHHASRGHVWANAIEIAEPLRELSRMITDHEGRQLNPVWLFEPGNQIERIDRAFRSLRYAREPLPMVETAEDAARLMVWCDARLRDLAGTKYTWWLEEWSRRANGMLKGAEVLAENAP